MAPLYLEWGVNPKTVAGRIVHAWSMSPYTCRPIACLVSWKLNPYSLT